MPQFSLTRSIKARRDLEARLRRNKLLHGRSAFVDRPDDGVRGRRLVPICRWWGLAKWSRAPGYRRVSWTRPIRSAEALPIRAASSNAISP